MFLVRLIYTSRITKSFGPTDIDCILNSARKNNKENNLTGLLFFNNKCFLQCLEGSRKMVNQTYNNIQNDKRHSDIILISYEEVIEREFEEWSMGYMHHANVFKNLNLKYSGKSEFEPEKMSAGSTFNFMLEIKEMLYKN